MITDVVKIVRTSTDDTIPITSPIISTSTYVYYNDNTMLSLEVEQSHCKTLILE